MKRFLKSRNVGMCACHNRLLNFHVVRSTRPTQFIFPQFTVENNARMQRTAEHKDKAAYPDEEYYLNAVQKYFFRADELRPLRVGQFLRYFAWGKDEFQYVPPAKRVDENTVEDVPDCNVESDTAHRHWHCIPASMPSGKLCRSTEYPSMVVRRRHNARLCVPRSAFIEPLGPKRETFYERKLLENLPWFCTTEPRTYEGDTEQTWDCLLYTSPSPRD